MSTELGPLPEPFTRQWINAPFTERLLFSEEQMRAYAAAEIAKERERCAKLCEWLPIGTGLQGKTFAEAIRGKGMGGELLRKNSLPMKVETCYGSSGPDVESIRIFRNIAIEPLTLADEAIPSNPPTKDE
jgi:hypothetical protein